MKAWKVTSEHNVELADLGSQSVASSCVKLKMLTSSVDGTEIAVYNAGTPVILGRNGVGIVSEAGDEVVGFKRGDRVYIRPVSSCGECRHCRSGHKSECEHSYTYGRTEDGVLRDFIVVPQSDLILLPQRVSPAEGVFIETVGLAIAALDKLSLEKGEHIVIMGASNVGLILAQAALYYQAVPILVDMDQERLSLAEKAGIYYTINAVDVDPVKKIFSITCGKMAETMAYCLTSDLPVQRSLECLERGGRAAFVGFDVVKRNLTFNFMPVLEKGISVASITGAEDNYLSAVNMIASKALDVAPLIGKHIGFNDVKKYLAENENSVSRYATALVEIDKL